MSDSIETFVLSFAESEPLPFQISATFAKLFYDPPGCHCFPGGPNCPCLEREDKEYSSGEDLPSDWLFIRYEDFALFFYDILGIEALCRKTNLNPAEKKRAEELTEMIKSGVLKESELKDW